MARAARQAGELATATHAVMAWFRELIWGMDTEKTKRAQMQHQAQQQIRQAEAQLNHPDAAVRAGAVTVLPDLPDAAAVRGLAQVLQDSDEHVRAEAAEALRQVSTPVVEAVVEVLTSAEGEPGNEGTRAGLPIRSPRMGAAVAHAIRESLARTGRTFSDSTELIREDRDR